MSSLNPSFLIYEVRRLAEARAGKQIPSVALGETAVSEIRLSLWEKGAVAKL